MVVYLRPGGERPSLINGEPETAVRLMDLTDFDSFTKSDFEPTCFVIDSNEPAVGWAILKQIRSNPFTATKPIFLAHALDRYMDGTCDGIIENVSEAYQRAIPINKLAHELDSKVLEESQDYRLLALLYTRPGATITPVKKWSNPFIYMFPLAESLAADGTDVWLWLKGLQDRKFLEPTALVDRIRQCRGCSGAHLNFVDLCPNCKSVDIIQKPFLHCFICGHIAPDENFLNNGFLTCPRCMAKLRHIGADYDRPLENYICNQCRFMFIDPKIMAECLQCEERHETDDLVAWPVHTLQITERGRMAARNGNLEDMYALLDEFNYIQPISFIFMLDWLLALQKRYPTDTFSLIGLELKNVLELTGVIGRLRTAELIDGFAIRLREVIRATDIVTRTNQRLIWILLPKTARSGCKAIDRRIKALKRFTRQEQAVELEFDTVDFSAPEDIQTGESAQMLLARLATRME